MTKIQYRRGTATQWTSSNPVLAAGEPGYETDTGKAKTGDGSTAWNTLAYLSAATGLTISTISSPSATQALNAGNAYRITLDKNATFSPSGGTSAQEAQIDALLTQNSTGGFTASWASNVVWLGGSAPVVPTAPGQSLLVTLATLDGGTTWIGTGAPTSAVTVSGTLLASLAYGPTTLATYTPPAAGAAAADVDATNLAITFAAPASGRVLITATFYADGSPNNSAAMDVGFREATSLVTVARILTQNLPTTTNAVGSTNNPRFFVSGLASGSSHTYKLAFRTPSGAQQGRILTDGGASSAIGPVIISVMAA